MSTPAVLVSTVDMPREEWLAHRRRGIGSSDAAAILGLNPWRSPIQVWLDKTGQLPEEEPGEAAHWGTVLEEVVAQEFTRRTGLKVRRRNAILQHPEHPWMIANVDRLIVGGGLLEAKTTSAYNADQWADGRVPYMYQVQVQHLLAVTGEPFAHIAVLIGGQRFVTHRLERDEEIIGILIEREREFWRLVETGEPPPMDGSDASADLLRRLYPEGEADKQVLLPLDAEALVRQYQEAKAEEDAAAKRRQEAENKIKALLGEAEVGLIAGEPVVTWKTIRSQRIDTKRLRAERPEIYQQYTLESVSRRFQTRRGA